MAGFVLGHLVDGVVDGVIAEGFGALGDGQFAFAGAAFGFCALLEVGLGVPDHLTEQFGDAGGVVGLLEGVAAEGVGHLRIALALGLAAHREVHAHLAAFAVEVVVQALHDLGVLNDTVAQVVLTGPLEALALDFDKLVPLRVALRTFGGRVLAFIDVSANQTSEFLFHIG